MENENKTDTVVENQDLATDARHPDCRCRDPVE